MSVEAGVVKRYLYYRESCAPEVQSDGPQVMVFVDNAITVEAL